MFSAVSAVNLLLVSCLFTFSAICCHIVSCLSTCSQSVVLYKVPPSGSNCKFEVCAHMIQEEQLCNVLDLAKWNLRGQKSSAVVTSNFGVIYPIPLLTYDLGL